MYNSPSVGQLANLTPRQVADNWTNAARQAESRYAGCRDAQEAALWHRRTWDYHMSAAGAWKALGEPGSAAQADYHIRQADKLAKPAA